KPILENLYIDLGKSDREIASFLNLDRTAIVHARRKFGIKARKSVGRKGELVAIEALSNLGIKVKDLNEVDRLSEYDLLLNDEIRIEVKSSNINYKGNYHFTLSDSEKNGCVESDTRIRLNNGKTKKIYEKTCDFIVLVGLDKGENHKFWIVPSDELPLDLQAMSISLTGNSKYAKYFNKWELIL